jgi:hypothetical protein
MRRLIVIAMATMPLLAVYGQPDQFLFIVGPRIGVSYVITSSLEFTEGISNIYSNGSYVPVMTIFGLAIEQRIILGQTNSHFAFQEMLMVGGLEQSIALPSLTFLIGYRDASGFEIGTGPTISFSGLGVIVAIGWTIESKGVFVPVDVSVVLPSNQRPTSIALTTGFNFLRRRSSGRR